MHFKRYIFISVLTILIASCDKYEAITAKDKLTSSVNISEELYLTNLLNSLQNEASQINQSVNSNGHIQSNTVNTKGYHIFVTEKGNWPQVIIVDYGHSNVTDANGVTHRGQIIIKRHQPDNRLGLITSTYFKNYYRNNIKVDGYINQVIKQTPAGLDITAIHDSISIASTNGNRFISIGAFIQSELNTTGSATYYQLTGQSKVIYADGTAYNREIADPLISKEGSSSFLQGQVQLVSNNTVQSSIKYGDSPSALELVTVFNDDIRTEYNIQHIIDEIEMESFIK